jgi:threonine/homoserine/homoserine lactone efflux protein
MLPSTSNLTAYLVLAAVIIVVPGPGVLFTIGRALILGTKAALVGVLGSALGVGVQIVVISLGLGVAIQQSDLLFLAIRIFGAGMIIYLGVKAILSRGDFDLDLQEKQSSASVVVRQSIVVGITNAKTFVFFVAALPSFTSPELGNPVIQMLLLGAIFSVIGIVSDSVYAIAAGQARSWLASSHQRLSTFRGIGGLALTLLGVYMLYEAIFH